jgi:hypothetical protein
MIGWHLARSLPDALAGWPFSRFAGVSMAVWFGYTALGAVVVMVIVRGRGRGLALPASCSLVLVTGVAVVALSDTSRSYFDRYNWAFYGAGWFALVATWHRPPPDFIVFCAATVTVGAAVLVARGDTDRVSVARFVAITYGFTAIQMTFFVGRRILLSIARDTAEAQNARARVVRQQEAARAVHAARRARYEVVQETAGRLLAELAT